jgi:hypothetical protein
MDLGVSIQNDGGRLRALEAVKARLKRVEQSVLTLVNVSRKQEELGVLQVKPVALFVNATLPKQENLLSREQRIYRNRPLL